MTTLLLLPMRKRAEKLLLLTQDTAVLTAARPQSGILEKDINLAVALKLRDVINSDGNTALLTRDSDEVKLLNNTSGKYVKKDDLLYRLSLIEDSGADLFISIHMNKFENPKYSGAQVFYSQNSETAKTRRAYTSVFNK
mgnify:CR=1 FL=1